MPEKHPLRPQRQPVPLGMAASSAMALFGRHRLPHRSILSRFLAALDQSTVEALRARFQEDLLSFLPII